MAFVSSSVSSARTVEFDHGAALRVPPPGDLRNWRRIEAWLGDQGIIEMDAGLIRVLTGGGELVANSGDWIVLSYRGEFHVARAERARHDA